MAASSDVMEGCRMDVREKAFGALDYLKVNLFDELVDILSTKQPAVRATTMGKFLELMQDPVLDRGEILSLGRCWGMADADEVGKEEMKVVNKKVVELAMKASANMLERAKRQVFARLHPDRYMNEGADTRTRARELFTSLTDINDTTGASPLLVALCLASLWSEFGAQVVEAARAYLLKHHGVVCAVRRSRRVRDGAQHESVRETFERFERERAEAEQVGKELRKKRTKQRQDLERRSKELAPGTVEHGRVHLQLMDMILEDHVTNRDDEMTYTPEPLGAPSALSLSMTAVSRNALAQMVLAGPAAFAPTARAASAPALERAMDEGDAGSAPGEDEDVRVVPPPPRRRRIPVLVDDDSDSEDEAEGVTAQGQGQAPPALLPSVLVPVVAAAAVPATDEDLSDKLRLGMHRMLVMAFFWFGQPVGDDSIRHSSCTAIEWLRHVVFVILELRVDSKEHAWAIDKAAIQANDFLQYKDHHHRVSSPWNAFKRFLRELSKPAYAHLEREALAANELTCTSHGKYKSGGVTMKNMKRRPLRPNKRFRGEDGKWTSPGDSVGDKDSRAGDFDPDAWSVASSSYSTVRPVAAASSSSSSHSSSAGPSSSIQEPKAKRTKSVAEARALHSSAKARAMAMRVAANLLMAKEARATHPSAKEVKPEPGFEPPRGAKRGRLGSCESWEAVSCKSESSSASGSRKVRKTGPKSRVVIDLTL